MSEFLLTSESLDVLVLLFHMRLVFSKVVLDLPHPGLNIAPPRAYYNVFDGTTLEGQFSIL